MLSLQSGCGGMIFHAYDLGLDSMTLIHKLDLYPVKMYMYMYIENELSRSRLSKARALYKYTDRFDQKHYHAASRMLISK